MAHFGLIGLGTMGQNLARNAASKGISTVVYNRSTEKMTDFISQYGSEHLVGESTLEAFVETLEAPRVVFLMVKAGKAVDAVIADLLPLLEAGDIIIDGGNTLFRDTQRREKEMKNHGIHYWGCGVSGGETGALHGPSMMPGGSSETWDRVRPLFEAIAAKDFQGQACVAHLGPDGAGHYVKMIHNGIEYAIMQMMAEVYQLLRDAYNMPAEKISHIFEALQDRPLGGYLTEIAVPVLQKKEGNTTLLDLVLDTAGQKGTGRWTAIDALTRGVELSSITGAVFARVSSSHKTLRTRMSELYLSEYGRSRNIHRTIEDIIHALEVGMILAYSEGFELISVASEEEQWDIDLQEVSRIWQGGCIIRSRFLSVCHDAFASGSKHLLENTSVVQMIQERIEHLRQIIMGCVQSKIPAYSLGGALTAFESQITARTSANMIQGLRDYFGAHTYERIDKDGVFHTHWDE